MFSAQTGAWRGAVGGWATPTIADPVLGITRIVQAAQAQMLIPLPSNEQVVEGWYMLSRRQLRRRLRSRLRLIRRMYRCRNL